MEHRWSMRRPLGGAARIYHDGGTQALESQIGDIGLEGMFIRTGDVNLTRNTLVEVEFALPGEPSRRYRLPALITHKNGDGIGLMFHTFDPLAFRAIQSFLYEPGNEHAG